MRRTLIATVAALAVVGAGLLTTSDTGPGPIPTCNGEQATHVLAAAIRGDNTSFTAKTDHGILGPFTTISEATHAVRAEYQEWIDAGVDVQVNTEAVLVGTEGHDVLVALVGTNSGGFVSNPAPDGPMDATAGDFACSYLKHADDVYYMTKGRGDFVFDAGGSDDYYMGGCELDGPGSLGDRKCDVMIDKGEGGVYTGMFHSASDAAWSFFVPKGRRTRFIEGPGQTHNYVGRGPGKVIVRGGACFVHIDGQRVPCVGHVPGNGDHIHPCPIDDNAVVDAGLEIKSSDGITGYDIEYFGPESQLGLPRVEQADPCAYQFRNR